MQNFSRNGHLLKFCNITVWESTGEEEKILDFVSFLEENLISKEDFQAAVDFADK